MGGYRSSVDIADDFELLSLHESFSRGGEILTDEEDEAVRLSRVVRKKDFKQMERVRGRLMNILEGLELHTDVFSSAEQQKIVNCIYDFQEKGRKGRLRERTYSESKKWMLGKGRVTIQFGCCYNYAVDKDGNPPGIIRDEEVDPIPPLLKQMIKRLIAWRVLSPTCIPNSCIVNIYDKDDCIPPHIDHHDFIRPFCTVSFLSECNIVFGTELKIIGPGDFSGAASIPLPLGSVLVLNGNGADVAKHCVPAVPARRISITFRKMDDTKLPYMFFPDPEMQNLRPVPLRRQHQHNIVSVQQNYLPAQLAQIVQPQISCQVEKVCQASDQHSLIGQLTDNDFPPLSSSTSMKASRRNRMEVYLASDTGVNSAAASRPKMRGYDSDRE